MSAFSRNKGKRGELAVCHIIFELTGWNAHRRVRNDHGDTDLVGIPGWAVEVKDHAKATMGDVNDWWQQACNQAKGNIPLLVYKRQRGEWRCVYPLSIHLCMQEADWWKDYSYTVETSMEGWAAVAREVCNGCD
jgi:hypothetical protein